MARNPSPAGNEAPRCPSTLASRGPRALRHLDNLAHFVGLHRLAKALQADLALGHAGDLVTDEDPGRMAQENATGLALRLQPCREVHLAADGRVFEPGFRAEVTYARLPRVDTHANPERPLDALCEPLLSEIREPCLHL